MSKKKPSKFDDLLKGLEIDETFTKSDSKKAKVFTKVKEQVPPNKNYNQMADLLMLPKTKAGYRYLLVVVDLYTDAFDYEPLKNKTAADVLSAFKKMFKRKYIKKPYASMATDDGSEFKAQFKKYLYDSSIYHKVAQPDRHTQQSNVERLNRELGRILNGMMNKKEEETGKRFAEWVPFLDPIRKKLNEYRIERADELREKKPTDYMVAKEFKQQNVKAKFNEGQLVYYKLNTPEDTLGKKLGGSFREGDRRYSKEAKKIERVLKYSGPVPYRYLLEGKSTVSFTGDQLMLSKDNEKDNGENQSTFKIKKIIGERTKKKLKEYLVWWVGYLKKDATWEPLKQLKEDVGQGHVKDLVKQYKDALKK